MVLLKNDNALPLTGKKQKIAIFGRYHTNCMLAGRGQEMLTRRMSLIYSKVLQMQVFVNKKLEKLYSTYLDFDDEVNDITMEKYGFSKLLCLNNILPSLHLIRIFLRQSCRFFGCGTNYNWSFIRRRSDRKQTDFYLSDNENTMISNVCSSFHKRLKRWSLFWISVGYRDCLLEESPDAIILAWQPGQEGGNSIADILSGKFLPSGKLPDTYPMNITDIPSTKNFPTDYNGVQSWDSKSSAGLTGSNVEKQFTRKVWMSDIAILHIQQGSLVSIRLWTVVYNIQNTVMPRSRKKK